MIECETINKQKELLIHGTVPVFRYSGVAVFFLSVDDDDEDDAAAAVLCILACCSGSNGVRSTCIHGSGDEMSAPNDT